jgi:hypothetical protein
VAGFVNGDSIKMRHVPYKLSDFLALDGDVAGSLYSILFLFSYRSRGFRSLQAALVCLIFSSFLQ